MNIILSNNSINTLKQMTQSKTIMLTITHLGLTIFVTTEAKISSGIYSQKDQADKMIKILRFFSPLFQSFHNSFA